MEKEEKKERVESEAKGRKIEKKSGFEEAINNIVLGIDAVDLDLQKYLGSYQAAKETENFPEEAEQLFSRFASSTKSEQPASGPSRSGKILYQPIQYSPPIHRTELPPRGIATARNNKLLSKSVIQPSESVAIKYYKPREDYLKGGIIQSPMTSRESKGPSPKKIIRNYQFGAPTNYSFHQSQSSSPGMIQFKHHRNPL